MIEKFLKFVCSKAEEMRPYDGPSCKASSTAGL
jgi:hypothetical protein